MPTMSSRLIAFGGVVFVLAGACRPPADVSRETESLLAADRAWSEAAAAGKNADSIVGFWTDDARVAMAGQPLTQGKAAIRQMVDATMAVPGFHISWTPESAVVAASGDLGYTFGTNTVTAPDATGKLTTVAGRYITVWRKGADGRWRCVMDYSNSGPPPASGT
jgi:ketosteroid isomerase-like protein